MVYLIKWQGSVHIEYKYISLHLKATKLLGFFVQKTSYILSHIKNIFTITNWTAVKTRAYSGPWFGPQAICW